MKFLSGLETTWYRMLTEEQIENEIPRKSELLFTFWVTPITISLGDLNYLF